MELENKWQSVDGYNKDTALLEDIIFEEILPRLPMSSLLRFKRVCKKWLHSMENDKRLALNHVRHQSTTSKLSIILSHCMSWLPWDYKLYFMDHRGGNNDNVAFMDSTLYIQRHVGDFTSYRMVGSCNGLICLCLRHAMVNPEPLVVLQSKGDAVVLWNPITREVRDTAVVPPLPPRFFVGRSSADYPAHGFGYDESCDDYKVVRIIPTSQSVLNISVFSRNSGCWRQLDKCLVGYTVCNESSESVLLDGRLYWLLLALEFADGGMFVTSRQLCVLSFSVRDEEFKIISILHNHTPYVAPSLWSLRQLVKWDNCLALACFPDDRPGERNSFGFELLLDRNGSVVVGQHASGVVGFRWSSHAPSFSENGREWKFCGVSRDRFLVEENQNLVMYDPFSHDYENAGRQEAFCAVGNLYSAHDYVPSLVSGYPDRKTMTEEKRKMEVRHWVDMFWNNLGLTRPQFGIRTSD